MDEARSERVLPPVGVPMFGSRTAWIAAPRAGPAGMTLFAVGDVHGYADELQALHALIRGEIDRDPQRGYCVVHLGDYIDRGPDSRRVLEVLEAGIGRDVEQIFLVGNHDQYLVELLALDPSLESSFIEMWYENGGTATMQNLGVEGYGRLTMGGNLRELRDRTAAALGPRLVDFTSRLQPMYRCGDYVFVHAGIDPAVPLESQDLADLLLIRRPFLGAGPSWSHPFTVVHGHSIAVPSVHTHRIGVDAGCYLGGVLCAVEIRDDAVRFHAATRQSDPAWSQRLGSPESGLVWDPPRPVC